MQKTESEFLKDWFALNGKEFNIKSETICNILRDYKQSLREENSNNTQLQQPTIFQHYQNWCKEECDGDLRKRAVLEFVEFVEKQQVC